MGGPVSRISVSSKDRITQKLLEVSRALHPTKVVVEHLRENRSLACLILRFQIGDHLPPAVSSPHQRHTTVTAQAQKWTFPRLLLALHNGLETGIYLHAAMLEPFDQPNCVKFLPKADNHTGSTDNSCGPAGESLTTSYLPRILPCYGTFMGTASF
jgi:hypothetical protein